MLWIPLNVKKHSSEVLFHDVLLKKFQLHFMLWLWCPFKSQRCSNGFRSGELGDHWRTNLLVIFMSCTEVVVRSHSEDIHGPKTFPTPLHNHTADTMQAESLYSCCWCWILAVFVLEEIRSRFLLNQLDDVQSPQGFDVLCLSELC